MRLLTSARWRHEHRRALRVLTAAGASVVLLAGLGTAALAASRPDPPSGTSRSAGRTPTESCWPPSNGSSRSAPGCWSTRTVVSCLAIAPNGQYLAALTWNDFTGWLTIVNVKTGQIIQQVGTGATGDPIIGDGTVAADGPLWSADGKSLWFPQTSDLVHFGVAADGTVSSPVVIPLDTTIVNLTTGDTTVPDGPSGMALELRRHQALRRPQRGERAGRHRHGDQQADQGHQGRQRPAPGGAGRGHRDSSPTRVAARPSPAITPITPPARTSWPTRSPAPPPPARSPRSTW